MGGDNNRGSIAFFATYRPPVPLDIFSCPADPPPSSEDDEVLLTDGESYNQNGRPIPAGALKELLTFIAEKKPELVASECGAAATPDDVDKGRVTGLLFVSERDDGLETLHVALRFGDKKDDVKVLPMAAIYGDGVFGGVRMEDSPCIAGGFTVGDRYVGYSLVYVSTKEPASARRTPWTAVYKTNLADGATERLTPPDQYDLSPAVSPSGKMVAVANFRWNQWTGEIEKLKTDIVVMNVDREAQGGLQRRILMLDDEGDVLPSDDDNNGGWPTWGSDNVIFFHRWAVRKQGEGLVTNWGVFRYDIAAKNTVRVTPEKMDAMTPAAISESKVAVATIHKKSDFMDVSRVAAQYRHIEIFDVNHLARPVEITLKFRPLADHYNPFVLDGGSRVGYHRCQADKLVQVTISIL
ncbi:unnamed protein product [Urochloa humidicola]